MFTLMLIMTLGIPGLTATGLNVQLTQCKPPDWYEVGPYCAKHFHEQVPFLQAFIRCRGHCVNCRLISIHDAKINDLIKVLTGSWHNRAWIGAYRLEHSVYTWTDGSNWNYQNWAPGEPNGNGNCVQFNFHSPGKWDDVECHEEYGYVCGFKKGQVKAEVSRNKTQELFRF